MIFPTEAFNELGFEILDGTCWLFYIDFIILSVFSTLESIDFIILSVFSTLER